MNRLYGTAIVAVAVAAAAAAAIVVDVPYSLQALWLQKWE